MDQQKKADLMLLIITIFWGTSYTFTKIGLETLQPFNLTALRFVIAFFITGIIFFRRLKRANKMIFRYSLILATILFIVFMTMTFGLKYTTASNAGFLIALSVIFIPIIDYMFFKEKISTRVKFSVLLAFIGITLLTLNAQLRMNFGDFLLLISAVLFGLHVVITGKFTIKKEVDSITLGVVQLGYVAIFSTIFSASIENFTIPSTSMGWIAILVLSILCTAAGYIVQTTAQQYTTPTHTGLIFSLEPIFSAFTAFFLIGEILSLRGYLGALILMIAVVNAEFNYKKFFKRNKRKIK